MSIKTRLAFAAIVYLCTSGISMANPNLADEKDCFSCHSIDEKSIGPAYQDVAAKYAGQSDAEAYLINKVLNGSRGDWGRRRMPANDNVNKDEARVLVEWILSLKRTASTQQPVSDHKE
ncbi:MAG TPA: c-type cytochrome [Burkholderiaceae bacterium]